MANDENESIISHLEALRSALLKCFISLAVILPFAFFISPPHAMNFLIKILAQNAQLQLNFFSPLEVFILQIKIALIIDFIICFPYISKKLWDFILPALYDDERKVIKSTVFISCLLFIFGVLFCSFLILPLIINFGLSFVNSNIHALFNITTIINLALWLCVVFGLMFQIPLVVHYLIKWDIISYSSISNKRPYVVLAILVISSFLTPPDIISQILLFTPTYLLFEAGLLFSKRKKVN